MKHVEDLHKKPGKGAVEVFVYVDSIEDTMNVRSFISSFIRTINLIRVLVVSMNPRIDHFTPLIENQGSRRKATGRERARRKRGVHAEL